MPVWVSSLFVLSDPLFPCGCLWEGIWNLLAALQFPVFGFILSYIREYKHSILFSLINAAIWFHIVVSLLGLVLVLISIVAA
jgi:hypothetical protein